MRVLALRPRPFALACLLCFSIVRLPSPASAQSLDISDPPCGLAADTALGATRYTNVKFHHYKVPVTVSRRANRDYEFLWSDTYRSVLHMPLDTLTGTPARTDIDRLALTACEEW